MIYHFQENGVIAALLCSCHRCDLENGNFLLYEHVINFKMGVTGGAVDKYSNMVLLLLL